MRAVRNRSKAAAEERGFSNPNGQAAAEKLSSQNYVSTKEAGIRTGNGMDLCNAALEQLGYKVKEEGIITASAKAAGEKAVTWAANLCQMC